MITMKHTAPFIVLAWFAGAIHCMPQTAWLEGTRLTGGGGFECGAAAWRGAKRVETSSNLSGWTSFFTTNALTFTIRDFNALSYPQRFFRVVCDGETNRDDLALEANSVRSTSFAMTWRRIADATAVRLYLAGEPCCPDVGLPAQKLVATLPGTVTNYSLTGLAPAVDCFVRAVVDTPAGPHAGLVHARTLGGPRAALDTPVREVLGWAPNALLVVVPNQINNAYDSGTNLQTGWQVTRANGAAISVVSVHRHSIPVGAPAYGLGPVPSGDPNVIDVDHRLFLMLAEPIGSPEVLTVQGPRGIQFTLPFSDRYLETPVIQLNQVGYNPRATRRYAYMSGWMGDGGPLALDGFPASAEILVEGPAPTLARGSVLAELPLQERSASDTESGTEVREVDLAGLPAKEGARYRVRLPGVGVSWPTAVSEQAAFKAFYTVARGLFHNRWGGDLRTNLTEWSRPADHPTVFRGESLEWLETNGFPNSNSTPRVDPRPLRGGYHDAGDFDIRPIHTYVAQLLMRAYEITPEAFVDGQLNLPESGNGVPDLLDEALWGVAAWEQLQEADGGVRLGVESYDHPPNQGVLANQDTLPYWTYGRDPNHTARCAGLFAQAARLLQPFDATRSDALRLRALSAWQYATNQGAAAPLLLYPAGELFRLTGDSAWSNAFRTAWTRVGPDDEFRLSRIASIMPNPTDYQAADQYLPDYVLAYVLSASDGAVPVGRFQDMFRNFGLLQATFVENQDAFRNARPQNYPWGFGQGMSMGRYFWHTFAALQMPTNVVSAAERQQMFDGLSLAADYILGGNPDGLVYLTGLGTRRVEEPLHLDSLAFIKAGQGPMPGIPAYGPSDEMYCPSCDFTAATRAAFHPAYTQLPRARRFGDVRLLIVNTEFSVWECQAPHVELFAVLMRGTAGILPPASYLPGRPDHRNPLP